MNKEYFTWKGIWDEMISLKKAYGERGVPKEIWAPLEAMCQEAVKDMALAEKKEWPS